VIITFEGVSIDELSREDSARAIRAALEEAARHRKDADHLRALLIRYISLPDQASAKAAAQAVP